MLDREAIILAAAVLSGCAAPSQALRVGGGEAVTVGVGLTFADGAAARRQADAQCGGRGVRTSIYDRFDAGQGAWVFPEGCA